MCSQLKKRWCRKNRTLVVEVGIKCIIEDKLIAGTIVAMSGC